MFLLKYDTELLKWVSLWLYCKNVNQKEKEVFKIFKHLVWKMYWAGTFIIAIYMVISKSIMIVLMSFLNSIPILLLRFFKVMCSEVTDKSQISATNGHWIMTFFIFVNWFI